MQALSRPLAAALLTASHPVAVLNALTGRDPRFRGGLRTALSILASSSRAPHSYPLWIELFDTWSEKDLERLVTSTRRGEWPRIRALIFSDVGATSEATRATQDSLRLQVVPTHIQIVQRGHDELRQILSGATEDYIALLQSGEVLPRHGIAVLCEQVVLLGRPAALCADEDLLSSRGERYHPHFKPEPNRTLMLSGTLTRGVWLFRRDVIARFTDAEADWAEALRLDLGLRLYEHDGTWSCRRIPYVLTHRGPGTEMAPPAILAQVVEAHFRRTAQHGEIDAFRFPLRVRPVLAEEQQGNVTLIVPSACRARHVQRCVTAVLTTTAYRQLDLTIVISQDRPLDAAQTETLRAITADPRVRVMTIDTGTFNYARANNEAVRKTDAEFVCLLNDDVAPMDPLWLTHMLGHFADPAVGVVGAKLYYGNATVQHGGIIMGIGGLAEHAHRFLPRGVPGYGGRAVLNQELSAVTGACLLVRRGIYEMVGGLDEAYPIAFNDVDFCLKVGEAGWSVVLCADAELVHYEGLSLGRHFAGARALMEAVEASRMRARWAQVIKADPFHNPNLSLHRGQEWEPAFPPRVASSRILRNS
jgi:GT2 family glycosyltransferase